MEIHSLKLLFTPFYDKHSVPIQDIVYAKDTLTTCVVSYIAVPAYQNRQTLTDGCLILIMHDITSSQL